jgi:hypothetical protein
MEFSMAITAAAVSLLSEAFLTSSLKLAQNTVSISFPKKYRAAAW